MEMKMNDLEKTIITLWNKGVLIPEIAKELRIDEDLVEMIVENEANYQ